MDANNINSRTVTILYVCCIQDIGIVLILRYKAVFLFCLGYLFFRSRSMGVTKLIVRKHIDCLKHVPKDFKFH